MPPASRSAPSARRPGRPAGMLHGAGREALFAAARALLAERGLPRVTSREVAERAGVRPALVNYYFGGRQGLLRSVVEEVAGSLRARILSAAAGEGSPEARLRALLRAWIGALAEDPCAARLMVEAVLYAESDAIGEFSERFARPALEVIRRVLEEGRACGQFRAVDPLVLVPCLGGMCASFFLAAPVVERLFGLGEIGPQLAERFAESTAELLWRGVAAPAGGAA